DSAVPRLLLGVVDPARLQVALEDPCSVGPAEADQEPGELLPQRVLLLRLDDQDEVGLALPDGVPVALQAGPDLAEQPAVVPGQVDQDPVARLQVPPVEDRWGVRIARVALGELAQPAV